MSDIDQLIDEYRTLIAIKGDSLKDKLFIEQILRLQNILGVEIDVIRPHVEDA